MKEEREALLTEFIKTGQEDFYRFAYSYVGDKNIALDVVGEACLKAFCGVVHLRKPEYLKTWFYRILINESKNHFNKNKKYILTEVLPETTHAQEGIDIATRLDLHSAIAKLNPGEKAVVILRFFEEQSLEEIAQTTKTNVSTVKSRLYRALDKLKINMEAV